MFRFLPLIASAALLASFVRPSMAQDQPERPPLPDIAPRTVEIRGALEIFFPALERQPLIGFNPPPRIVDVSDRRPFVEEYRLGAADLPPSPLQAPGGPSLAGLDGIERRTGIIEARAGRYLARHTSARIEHAFSPAFAVTADIAYDGRDGHRPFEFEPDARSAFDNLRGQVGLHRSWETSRLSASIDGFRSNYSLFGASGSTVIPPLRDMPGRDAADLRGTISYRSATGPMALETRFRIRGSSIDTSVCPTDNAVCRDDDTSFHRDQNGVEWSGSVTLDDVAFQPRIAARVASSGFDTASLIGSDVVTSQVDVGVRLIDTPGMRLSAGASMMHFSTGSDADRPDATALYLSPDVRLDFYPGGGAQVYVVNRPSVGHPFLADVITQNPYITHRPEMHPTVNLIDTQAGVRLYRGVATIDLSAGFIDAPRYRFFEYRAGGGGYSEGVFAVDHQHARILHAGGEASVIVGGRSTASLSLRLRDARLVDAEDDDRVPNVGPLAGRAALSVPLIGGRLLTEAGLRYESARYRDVEQTRRVGDFFDLDARAAYRINHMVSAVVAIENISAGHLEYWGRYPQAPFVVSGGLQITW